MSKIWELTLFRLFESVSKTVWSFMHIHIVKKLLLCFITWLWTQKIFKKIGTGLSALGTELSKRIRSRYTQRFDDPMPRECWIRHRSERVSWLYFQAAVVAEGKGHHRLEIGRRRSWKSRPPLWSCCKDWISLSVQLHHRILLRMPRPGQQGTQCNEVDDPARRSCKIISNAWNSAERNLLLFYGLPATINLWRDMNLWLETLWSNRKSEKILP